MSHTLDMEKARCLLFNRVQNKDPEGRDDFLMTKTPQRLAEVRPEPLCLRALESVVSYFMVHALLVTDNGVRTQKKKVTVDLRYQQKKERKGGAFDLETIVAFSGMSNYQTILWFLLICTYT